MLPDALQALLVLQDRDIRRLQLEKVLAHIPHERAAVEKRIEGYRAGIAAARKVVTDLELRRKELEGALGELEEQVLRYRSQQLQIRKNDEFQALTHEIERTESKIGETEEAEIRLLYDLDREREATNGTERQLSEAIAAEEAQLVRLAEREMQVGREIAGAKREVEKAREPVPAEWLGRYDRLAGTIGLPVVVPLRDQKCGGCHLKVSAGVDAEVRKLGKEIVACDNCSRLLFCEV